jgi:hypothetical protein
MRLKGNANFIALPQGYDFSKWNKLGDDLPSWYYVR